jgi:hypothetical protein
VNVPLASGGLRDDSFLGLLLVLVEGLAGLVELITGSRRENGGMRRDGRR